MSSRIRVAVTGLGVSRGLLKHYRESPDAELVLLHDLDAKRLQAVAEENPGARTTREFGEILKSDVDLVDVSTPNHVHLEQTIAALEAGKHVLCQKPMAPTVADCRRMCAAAKSTGRELCMNMTMLSQPHYHTLRAIVQKGLVGQVAAVRIRNAHRGPLRRTDKNHWRAKAANVGGGSFMQLAVHHMNAAQWMLDDEIVRVTGFAKNRFCQHSIEGEDTVAAAGEFRGGALIAMESGYSSVGDALEVFGTEGHLAYGPHGLALEANAPFKDDWIDYPGEGKEPGKTVWYPASSWAERKGAKAHFPDIVQLVFVRALRNGQPAPIPGEIGLRDVAIIQAIYLSAETGRAVEVKELRGK